MEEFLFEIGCEELPAHAVDSAQKFGDEYFTKILGEHKLEFSGLKVLATPRRITIFIKKLSTCQLDSEEEIIGPSIKFAFDQEGKLTKAGLGFCQSKNITPDKIYKKETKKGLVIAAKLITPGLKTRDIIPNLLITYLKNIPFKKRMRWEISGDNFSRPIRWLVVLLGQEFLKLNYADVMSDNYSYGHRFLAPEKFKISSSKDYFDKLEKKYVILDSKIREQEIVSQASKKALSISGIFNKDQELLDIVKNLVEYPVVILGNFEKKYLDIPKEILICEMKSHQKCFALINKSDELLPNFITVSNMIPDNEERFAQGNARVLRARFEDGAFYFKQDLSKTLEQHGQNLKNLVFERDLGSFFEKTQRIINISQKITQVFNLSSQEKQELDRAASLCKADLVTGVVGEFPELEGVMGGIYAQKNGEPPQVCQIIREHYWPRFADDNLPIIKPARVLSLADKLDTLVGIFLLGKKPKANKDPYGLRRAAIGIIRIILDSGVRINLDKLINIGINNYKDKFKNNNITQDIHEFILLRARGIFLEEFSKLYKPNITNYVDSVLQASNLDLVDIYARIKVLLDMSSKNQEEFINLTQTFKRASNLVKKELNKTNFDKKLLSSDYEKSLILCVEMAKNKLNDFDIKNNQEKLCENYRELFDEITKIKPKLDNFFENTMVMVEDEKLRSARLGLLREIKLIAHSLADFTHLK